MRRRLEVGSVDDPAEREADAMADRAMGMLDALGRPDAHDRVRRSPSGRPTSAPPVARARVRRRADGVLADPAAGGALDDRTSGRIERARGGGRQLPDTFRSQLEHAFDSPLDSVRVHTGPEAADLSSSISARAFTTGSDIFFGAGQYQPDSAGGQRLIAHEIAHTLQDGGHVGRQIRREGDDDGRAEAERQLKRQMFDIAYNMTMTQLQLIQGQLPIVMNLAGQALAEPGLIATLTALKQSTLAYIDVLEKHQRTLSAAWADLEPYLSSHPAFSALAPFEEALESIEHQCWAWKALIEGTGPGGTGSAAIVFGEVGTARNFLSGMGSLVNNFFGYKPPPGQGKTNDTPNTGVGSSTPGGTKAPGQSATGPSSPSPKPPSSTESQPSTQPDIVTEAVENFAPPPRVPKFYPYTKARSARYEGENIDGSADLPYILDSAKRAVKRGKVRSVGQYMMENFGWQMTDLAYLLRRRGPLKTIDKPREEHEAERFGEAKVRYLEEQERPDFELHGGSTISQGTDTRNVFDTYEMFSKHSGNGWGIYVMARDGAVYADQHRVGLFHHSSFLAGASVAAAGEIKVDNGTLEGLTNKTGHYLAGPRELWQVIDEFKSRGASLSGVSVTVVDGNPGPGTKYPGGAAKFWEDEKP